MDHPQKKVEQELEEYKKQFQIPGSEVKLIPFNYPESLQKDVMLKIEADRIRRQIEYD